MRRARWLLPVCAVLMMSSAGAASFDCRKAATVAEKTICEDTALSRLDERLAAVYKAALEASTDRAGLVASQRSWNVASRQGCTDAACLARLYMARIDWLAQRTNGPAPACPVKEAQLAGTWVQVDNDDFEESEIGMVDGERYFMSWRHHRPELSGAWALRDCVLHIDTRTDGKLDIDWRIKGLRGSVLELVNVDTGDVASYRRETKR